MFMAAALFVGERIGHTPSALALGSMLYQTIWIVCVTYVLWFAMIVRYSANRLSVFTFLTPLFGVAAGHLVLGEPLTLAFAAAVGFVALGLVLVNRAK
jgi:drug/metabolite transporter (DMT)-like permease